MKRRCALATSAMLALFASMPTAVAPSADAVVGLHVSGRNIVEANGGNFVMRGAAHPHVWFHSQTSSFANIKSLGANVVRMVSSAVRLDSAVNYWRSMKARSPARKTTSSSISVMRRSATTPSRRGGAQAASSAIA